MARSAILSGSHEGKTSSSRRVHDRRRPEALGQSAPFGMRLHDRHLLDTPCPQCRHAQRPDGSRAEDHHRVARRHTRPSDAVERHRERLGQCGMASREPVRQPEHARSPGDDVLGEGPIAVVAGHRGAVLALGRLALTATPAATAPRGRSPDDELAHGPAGHRVADGGDRPRPLVSGHPAGRETPPVA